MEHLFASFFEASHSPAAITVGPEYRLAFVNEAWLSLFGYSKEETIGRTSQELGIQRDAATRQQAIEAFESNAALPEQEFVLHHKDGHPIRAVIETTRITLEDQEFVLSTLHDVSELTGQEESLHSEYADRLASLTQREREVLRLAIAGYCNKDIARILGVSCRTVEAHRSHCIHKLGTRNLLRIKQIADSGNL